MEIRFISSLTADDESLYAPAVLKAVSALLDQLPIAYTMRIETTGAHVFQHTHVAVERSDGADRNDTSMRDASAARLMHLVSPYGVRGRHET